MLRGTAGVQSRYSCVILRVKWGYSQGTAGVQWVPVGVQWYWLCAVVCVVVVEVCGGVCVVVCVCWWCVCGGAGGGGVWWWCVCGGGVCGGDSVHSCV